MSDVREIVGRYEVVGRVGRGGMGVVHLARQLGLDRHVALKELAALDAADPTFARRFLQEARVAGAMSHPNIVTVFDYFEDGGTAYIAMEYLELGSLRPFVSKLSVHQAVGVLEGTLAGLAHAHADGVIHRDLKPENLLVTKLGGIKIADFGIAKALNALGGQSLTATGMAIGSPTYMAPEQALATEIGPWTDLYALGIIAYELFVGRVPFAESDTPMAILWKQVHDPVPAPRSVRPDLDSGLADWLERLLTKEPAQRPQSAHEAWAALEAIVVDMSGHRWRSEASLVETDGGRPRIDTPASFLPSGGEPTAEAVSEPPDDYETYGGLPEAVAPPPSPPPSPPETIRPDPPPPPPSVPEYPPPPVQQASDAPQPAFAPPAPAGGATVVPPPWPTVRPARRSKARWIVAAVAASVLALAAAAGALLVLGGGESATGDTTPTIPRDPTTPPRKTVETFGDPSDSWFRSDRSDIAIGSIEQGGYRMRIIEAPNYLTATNDFDPATKHALGESRIGPGDVRLTVDVAKLGGPNDNEFGVLCLSSGGRGYWLGLSSDGYAGIWRQVGDDFTDLRSWKQSQAIQQGAGTNHIVAECRGGRAGAPAELRLSANGDVVARVRDVDGLPMTFFGIYANALDEPGVDVLFDNFALERLDYPAFLERFRARQ